MNIGTMLEREEGLKSIPYYCTSGYPTVGIGWRIGDKHQSLSDFKHIKLCQSAAHAQCEFQVAGLTWILSDKFAFFKDLSEPRQCVLISMAYQMGVGGLMRFKKMIAAIEVGDFVEAAQEGMNSRWANQTYARANRHMRMMLTDDWSVYSQLIDQEI